MTQRQLEIDQLTGIHHYREIPDLRRALVSMFTYYMQREEDTALSQEHQTHIARCFEDIMEVLHGIEEELQAEEMITPVSEETRTMREATHNRKYVPAVI